MYKLVKDYKMQLNKNILNYISSIKKSQFIILQSVDLLLYYYSSQ